MENSNKREFILEGLCCANCASKIETKVNNLEGVSNVSVNFITTTLAMDIDNLNKTNEIIDATRAIVSNIEPDVIFKEKEIEKFVKKVGPKIDTMDKSDNNSAEHNNNKKKIINFGISALIFATALIFNFPEYVELILYLTSYLLVGGEVILKAIRNILKGQIFDENFLMSVATIGAFSIKQFPEGVGVMLFYQIGEFFQGIAVNNSRKSISSLLNIRPDSANLKIGDDIKRVSPEEVEIGDIIIIKPGEKVPLDSIVIEGTAMLDTSALTGESVPRRASVGDAILGGSINENGLITARVSKEFGESTVAKILNLVQNANSKKAPIENFITKFARYYTPVVVFSALALGLIPPILISGATFSPWIYRALVFLVVSCPCALVISIPLGFFGGIGGASRQGILVKGGDYMEALSNAQIVVFDKTGTLTKGVFKVNEVYSTGVISKEELLEYAAYAENYSSHPIATSIQRDYEQEIDESLIKNYNEISGHGIKAEVKGNQVLAGNTKLMEGEGIIYSNVNTFGTVVHLAVNKQYVGYLVISDVVKEDSAIAIKALKSIGVRKTVMLTGDNELVGTAIGKQLGLDEIYSELLPDQKVAKLEVLEKQKSSKGKLIFVGDGINDAPVLARADIGIAMGGVGSDAAIEAADVVIMTDEPYKIYTAIKIAKKTKNIVLQNIIFALGVKVVIMILGALGIANMWQAVFGDVGVTIIAVINSMRAMIVDDI